MQETETNILSIISPALCLKFVGARWDALFRVLKHKMMYSHFAP